MYLKYLFNSLKMIIQDSINSHLKGCLAFLSLKEDLPSKTTEDIGLALIFGLLGNIDKADHKEVGLIADVWIEYISIFRSKERIIQAVLIMKLNDMRYSKRKEILKVFSDRALRDIM